MAAVTFGDAAAHLGHKSRSTLYRLKRDGFLSDYLRPGGKGGAQLLELEPDGLPSLRDYCRGILVARVDSPLWAAAEPEPVAPPIPEQLAAADGSEPFWSEWGRIAGPDEPPLADDEFWGHVGRIVEGMMGRQLNLSPGEWAELAYQLGDAVADVEAGARFDQGRWDAANVRSLLDCLPCDLSAAELGQLLAAGKVPADLVADVEAALAAADEQ